MSSKKFIVRLAVFLLAFFVVDLATSALMLKGINKFYGFSGSPAILINGSSMSLSGFNKTEIENTSNLDKIEAPPPIEILGNNDGTNDTQGEKDDKDDSWDLQRNEGNEISEDVCTILRNILIL